MTKYLTNREAAEAYLAGKLLEFELEGVWYSSHMFSIFKPDLDATSQYRLARVMIKREVEYPKPVTEPLKIGDEYWTANLMGETLTARHQWANDWYDKRELSRGIIYLTEADAIARAKAMIGGVE